MTERAILAAPEAARAAVAAKPALLPGRSATLVPPPAVRGRHGRLRLGAKALKVTLVLDPNEIAQIGNLDGAPPQRFEVRVAGRCVTGELRAKGLRRAQALIAEHGADKVAVIVQGKLEEGDVLGEAGIVAQVKGAKPATGEEN